MLLRLPVPVPSGCPLPCSGCPFNQIATPSSRSRRIVNAEICDLSATVNCLRKYVAKLTCIPAVTGSVSINGTMVFSSQSPYPNCDGPDGQLESSNPMSRQAVPGSLLVPPRYFHVAPAAPGVPPLHGVPVPCVPCVPDCTSVIVPPLPPLAVVHVPVRALYVAS